MPSSNRYPKPNPPPRRGSPNPGGARRVIPPYRPARPFEFTPPKRGPGMFPGLPRPTVPFGKRLPLPGYIPPVVPRLAIPMARMLARLNPWLLLAWGLYDLWQLYQQWEPTKAGNECSPVVPGRLQGYLWSSQAHCSGTFSMTTYRASQEWASSRRYLHQVELIPPSPLQPPSTWNKNSWTGPYTMPEAAEVPPLIMPPPDGEFPWPDWTAVPPVNVPVLPPSPMIPVPPWIPIIVPPLSPMPPPVNRPPWVDPGPNPEAVSPPRGYTPPRLGGRPRYRPTPRPNGRPQPELLPRRPGRGTKERKMAGSKGARRLIGKLASAYSEAADLIEVFHDALPEEYQARTDHPKAMFDALYKHWDKVNMDEAVAGMWKNQVSDRYQGKAFKDMQDALSEAGFDFPSPRGIGGTGFQHGVGAL